MHSIRTQIFVLLVSSCAALTSVAGQGRSCVDGFDPGLLASDASAGAKFLGKLKWVIDHYPGQTAPILNGILAHTTPVNPGRFADLDATEISALEEFFQDELAGISAPEWTQLLTEIPELLGHAEAGMQLRQESRAGTAWIPVFTSTQSAPSELGESVAPKSVRSAGEDSLLVNRGGQLMLVHPRTFEILSKIDGPELGSYRFEGPIAIQQTEHALLIASFARVGRRFVLVWIECGKDRTTARELTRLGTYPHIDGIEIVGASSGWHVIVSSSDRARPDALVNGYWSEVLSVPLGRSLGNGWIQQTGRQFDMVNFSPVFRLPLKGAEFWKFVWPYGKAPYLADASGQRQLPLPMDLEHRMKWAQTYFVTQISETEVMIQGTGSQYMIRLRAEKQRKFRLFPTTKLTMRLVPLGAWTALPARRVAIPNRGSGYLFFHRDCKVSLLMEGAENPQTLLQSHTSHLAAAEDFQERGTAYLVTLERERLNHEHTLRVIDLATHEIVGTVEFQADGHPPKVTLSRHVNGWSALCLMGSSPTVVRLLEAPTAP